MLALIVMIVAVVVATQVVDLRRQREVQALMEGVLTHRGQATVDAIALHVRENKHYLGFHVAAAHQLRADGRLVEAADRLSVGVADIQALAPGFLRALHTLRLLARCVSAIVALEPVSPARFRTSSLRTWARAGSILHYLLLTGRQRILLRMHVIVGSFRFAVRGLQAAAARIARRDSERQWQRADSFVEDLGTAGDEALLTTRQIAEALDAVEFGPILTHRAR
jgi:hypothetical protein